jgi:hypothetical protein
LRQFAYDKAIQRMSSQVLTGEIVARQASEQVAERLHYKRTIYRRSMRNERRSLAPFDVSVSQVGTIMIKRSRRRFEWRVTIVFSESLRPKISFTMLQAPFFQISPLTRLFLSIFGWDSTYSQSLSPYPQFRGDLKGGDYEEIIRLGHKHEITVENIAAIIGLPVGHRDFTTLSRLYDIDHDYLVGLGRVYNDSSCVYTGPMQACNFVGVETLALVDIQTELHGNHNWIFDRWIAAYNLTYWAVVVDENLQLEDVSLPLFGSEVR